MKKIFTIAISLTLGISSLAGTQSAQAQGIDPNQPSSVVSQPKTIIKIPRKKPSPTPTPKKKKKKKKIVKPTPTSTPTPTKPPKHKITPTLTPTPTATATTTPMPSPTVEPTPDSIPSETPTPTPATTPIPRVTVTPTPSNLLPTPTPVPVVPTPTPTPVQTPIPVVYQPPTLVLSVPATALEGASLTLTALASQGSGDFSFQWDLNQDGVFEKSGDTITWIPSDQGSYLIKARVTDNQKNASITASATVTVSNVAPLGTISGATSGVVGVAASFTGSATDVSSADTAAGFTFNWDFGDGTPVKMATASAQTHTFSHSGTFLVRMSTQDKDGAKSIAVQRSVVIAKAPVTAIPDLALWESHMTQYGRTHCAELGSTSSLTAEQQLANVYYDGAWVYYQIGDYTKDASWYTCAEKAKAVYRDQYVLPNNGKIPGYWNFSHGILQDYLRTGNVLSRDTVVLLSNEAAYTSDYTPISWTQDSTLSREVAYGIMAYLNAEEAGAPRRARLAQFVDQAYGHIDQWVTLKTAPYVRPFMVSLTAHALISYYEKTNDSRVIPALTKVLDWIWDNTWVPAAGSFRYTDRLINPGDLDPAPDLNLLIAPAYAWMYYQTGEIRFRDRGDQIFSGGVKFAWLGNGKQFDQSYRLSFEYVRLRKLQTLK